ncbi:MAG TPA: hypothetical protein DD435_14350 [Cyanobacteria bacterium UBA8530]|nr:hypothetical protein [Cyanobacteria bacterium UBA8530]
MRKASAFLTSAILTLMMFGCGVQTKTSGPSIPYPTPRFDGLDGLSDATGSTETSSDPGPQPSASPQGASHRFLRTIGSGVLRLPSGIAAFNDYLLICDGGHRDPIGNFSLAIRFGRDGNRQGEGYDWLSDRGDGVVRFPARIQAASAVCTDGTIVYLADKGGIYGFFGTTQKVLNGGNPYLSAKAQDMVQTPTALTLLGEGEISSYALPSFRLLFKGKATGVGLGIDQEGKVYLATSDSIIRYEDGQVAATLKGFSDLRDVATDPRNGDLYALEGHKILRLDAEGKKLESFGEFLDATSLSIDEDGFVYACDRGNTAIQAFEPCSPLE